MNAGCGELARWLVVMDSRAKGIKENYLFCSLRAASVLSLMAER